MPDEADISIVVEWDNVRLVNAPRAARMLERLLEQIVEFGRRTQVIVVHDPGELSSGEIEQLVAEAGFRAAGIDVTAVQTQGEHYYEMKNRGADMATAPIVVFVDSDVIPQPGWLHSMVESFALPDVDAVGANAYAGPVQSTYEKAFALFWLFSLRSPDAPPQPHGAFFANSCAFRREVLAEHRWPRASYIRYQNVLFLRSLERSGVRIWTAPCARVEHPIPRGRQFFRTALSEGHDAAVRQVAATTWRRLLYAPLYALALLPGRLLRYARRILPAGRRDAVGLSPAEVPAALAIAAAYALVVWTGFLVTLVAPDTVPRRYSV